MIFFNVNKGCRDISRLNASATIFNDLLCLASGSERLCSLICVWLPQLCTASLGCHCFGRWLSLSSGARQHYVCTG